MKRKRIILSAKLVTVLITGLASIGCTEAKVPMEKGVGGKKADVVVSPNNNTDKFETVLNGNTTPAKELLFFMNPNGRPCQMQDAILSGIKDSIAPSTAIRYYRTTDPAARKVFGEFGIRGLPTLVIVDKSGKEQYRFTPGVQSKEVILNALSK